MSLLAKPLLKDNDDIKQAVHLGMEKTYARIAENYFWPGMYSELLKYVKECDTCERIKPEINNQVGLLGKRIIEEPWTVLVADIMYHCRGQNKKSVYTCFRRHVHQMGGLNPGKKQTSNNNRKKNFTGKL